MTDHAHRGAVPPDPTRQAAQRLLAQIADGAWLTVEEAADVRLVAEAVMTEAHPANDAGMCASGEPEAFDPYGCCKARVGEACIFAGRGSMRDVCDGKWCRPRAPMVEAAIQAAREKLLACSMAATMPTAAENRLALVLRLVDEAFDVLADRSGAE